MPPPGRKGSTLPPARPMAAPSTAPAAASPATRRPSEAASPPGTARARKNRTNGSASPSFRPDSRFSVCLIRSGTCFAETTAELTTGSVAESTAPSRKASAQEKEGNRILAASARSARVAGIATTRARAGGPHCFNRSSRSTSKPSARRVTISASSISSTTVCDSGCTVTTSVAASTAPAVTERTEIDRTVPRTRPDRAAASRSRRPRSITASLNPMSISSGGLALAEEVALGEYLGDLDRVQGGTLAEVVAHDPEVQRALLAGIAPDPPDEDLVSPRGDQGSRVHPGRRVVQDDDSRRA